MGRAPDGPADAAALLRQFRDQLAGMDSADVTALAQRLVGGLGRPGRDAFTLPAPPSARRPRRRDVATLRVRVDLQGAKPPLWRRLELASDMPLSELHPVLQVAFGWTDSHLHRFGSGTSIYDQSAEAYLMPYEVEEGEAGVPEAEVRLDELLVDVGDRLTYGYDFGDDWMHAVRLEAVLPRDASAPRAVCTAGRRPGPAEDCGGVGGYELWCAATDPDHPDRAAALADITDMYGSDIDLTAHATTPFDIDAINSVLASPGLGGMDLPGPLADLVRGVRNDRDAAWLESAIAAIPRADAPDAEAAARAVRPFTWLLDHVGADGITLTAADYLPPAHVRAVADALGVTDSWIGKVNREDQTYPVLAFREAAQKAKLVRKHRGKLVLAPAGRKLRTDPMGLWRQLATQLPVGSGECERQAGLLLLIGVAAGWDDLDAGIARGLSAAGWVNHNGPLTPATAAGVSQETRLVLRRLGMIGGGMIGGDTIEGGRREPERATELGVAFARAAVWTWP